MMRKWIALSLVMGLIAALVPVTALAQEQKTVEVTLWNGEGRAWRYYRVDVSTTVILYYYWYAATEPLVQDFLAHADFEIAVDNQPLFVSQADVDALWEPVESFTLKTKSLMRAEWRTTLPPLAPGEHTVRAIITLDAPVQDGVAAQPFPAGTLHNTTNIITVVEGEIEAQVPPTNPAAAPPTPDKIYSDPVVGTFVSNAVAYWEPFENKQVQPTLILPQGMSLWVFGMDASRQYYKVVLDIAYLWVHVDTLGPNYDGTWKGAPLPNIVVQ
jgi:hypothetical protein